MIVAQVDFMDVKDFYSSLNSEDLRLTSHPFSLGCW
jgi:hypothetical protein